MKFLNLRTENDKITDSIVLRIVISRQALTIQIRAIMFDAENVLLCVIKVLDVSWNTLCHCDPFNSGDSKRLTSSRRRGFYVGFCGYTRCTLAVIALIFLIVSESLCCWFFILRLTLLIPHVDSVFKICFLIAEESRHKCCIDEYRHVHIFG